MVTGLDERELEHEIEVVYRTVSAVPDEASLFETSRELGERRGYLSDVLDRVASFGQSSIEGLPFENGPLDVVLENGTIAVSARKERVHRQARRVLAPYSRLTISELVAAEMLPKRIGTDAGCWAAGTGGVLDAIAYVDAIEAAAFEMIEYRENREWESRIDRDRDVCRRYGLKSTSLSARKHD